MRYDPFGRGMNEASKVVSRARVILSALVYIGLWCRGVGARLESTYTVSSLSVICISCVWAGLVCQWV